MPILNSDVFHVEDIIDSDDLKHFTSMRPVLRALSEGDGMFAGTVSKALLKQDKGSFTYPISGLSFDVEIDEMLGGGRYDFVAWEMFSDGRIGFLAQDEGTAPLLAEPSESTTLETCLEYLDIIYDTVKASLLDINDRQIIQRAAVQHLAYTAAQSTPGRFLLLSRHPIASFAADLPSWWPKIAEYARAQGVRS